MSRPSCVLISLVVALGAAWGCGESGTTPSTCPGLPLYDIHDAGYKTDPEVQAQLNAAYNAGCATPAGTAVSGTIDSGAPTGGTGGTSAQAGAGGTP